MHIDFNRTKDLLSKNQDQALTRPALCSVCSWLVSLATNRERKPSPTHTIPETEMGTGGAGAAVNIC